MHWVSLLNLNPCTPVPLPSNKVRAAFGHYQALLLCSHVLLLRQLLHADLSAESEVVHTGLGRVRHVQQQLLGAFHQRIPHHLRMAGLQLIMELLY